MGRRKNRHEKRLSKKEKIELSIQAAMSIGTLITAIATLVSALKS